MSHIIVLLFICCVRPLSLSNNGCTSASSNYFDSQPRSSFLMSASPLLLKHSLHCVRPRLCWPQAFDALQNLFFFQMVQKNLLCLQIALYGHKHRHFQERKIRVEYCWQMTVEVIMVFGSVRNLLTAKCRYRFKMYKPGIIYCNIHCKNK